MNLVPAQLITCDYKPEGDSHLQNSAFSRCCSCALTSPFQSGNSVVLSMVRVMQPTLMSQFRAFPSPQKEIPLLRPPPPHPLPQPLWLLLCSVPWICLFWALHPPGILQCLLPCAWPLASQGSPILQHGPVFNPFLWPNNTALCG